MLLLSILFFLISGEVAFADENILPLKDVKAGMKGIGKTVIHGHEIETFNIEVMGVLANNKINENVLITGKSILVKVSGKVIEDAGGIAAGMSGSPIYINGKLIGGLSSGWVMTDHTVGMVTPIEEMLEIWDYPLTTRLPTDGKPVKWISPAGIILDGVLRHTFWEVNEEVDLASVVIPSSDPVFMKVSTPVIVQGLSKRVINMMKSKFKMRNVQSAQTDNLMPLASPPATIPASQTVVFEPGSAIGIQLSRGDINLTTLGTLTYRDGKKILGFAHPFLKKGNVAFLLTGAHIYHSFSSVQMPFKIGAPTDTLGIVTQDREKGISGELGRFPTMVPIQIEVTDKDLKRSRSINYQVVRDPSVFGMVVESTLLQALEGVIDRDGHGTALMGITFEGVNNSGVKYNFKRENLFYSSGDIMNTLINEVTKVIEMAIDNDFEEITPLRFAIKIEIEQKRKTMTIEKVEVKNSSITPGGILEVWVSMRPFREKSIVKKARLPIPPNIGKEDLLLTVFSLASRGEGAGQGTGDSSEGKEKPEVRKPKEIKSDDATHDNFDSLMRDWANSPMNSDLLFQLSVVGDEEKKIKFDGKDFELQPTNLVVLGSVDTTITLSEE